MARFVSWHRFASLSLRILQFTQKGRGGKDQRTWAPLNFMFEDVVSSQIQKCCKSCNWTGVAPFQKHMSYQHYTGMTVWALDRARYLCLRGMLAQGIPTTLDAQIGSFPSWSIRPLDKSIPPKPRLFLPPLREVWAWIEAKAHASDSNLVILCYAARSVTSHEKWMKTHDLRNESNWPGAHRATFLHFWSSCLQVRHLLDEVFGHQCNHNTRTAFKQYRWILHNIGGKPSVVKRDYSSPSFFHSTK